MDRRYQVGFGPTGQYGDPTGNSPGQYSTIPRQQHQPQNNHYHTLPSYHSQPHNRNVELDQLNRPLPPPSLSRHTVKVLQMPIMVVGETNNHGSVPTAANPTVVAVNASPSPTPSYMINVQGQAHGPVPGQSPSPRPSSTSSSSVSYPSTYHNTRNVHQGHLYSTPPHHDTWPRIPNQAPETNLNRGGAVHQPNHIYSVPHQSHHDTWPRTPPPKTPVQNTNWNNPHGASIHAVKPEHIYSELQPEPRAPSYNKAMEDRTWTPVSSGSTVTIQPEHIYAEPQHDTWPRAHNKTPEEPSRNTVPRGSVTAVQPEVVYSEPRHDTWPKVTTQDDGQQGWTKVQGSSPGDVDTTMREMQENMERMQRQMQNQFRHLQVGAPPTANMPLAGDQPGFPNFPSLMPPPLANFPDSIIDIRPPSVQGMGLSSSPSMDSNFPSLIKPEMAMQPLVDTGVENRGGKKQLKFQLDMHDFNPEEVRVRAEKNKLEVSAHHEEKDPNRVTCRVFKQQYHLPTNVRMAKMQYDMTPDGELRVQGTVKPIHRVKFAENTLTK